MTLQDLIRDFRVTAQDTAEPHLFATEDVTRWLIEAEQEAAIRGRLIFDADTLQVCQISLVDRQIAYKLHPAVYEIVAVTYWEDPEALADLDLPYRPSVYGIRLVSREWLESRYPDWRQYRNDPDWPYPRDYPEYAVQDDTSIRFYCAPRNSRALMRLECYRLPIRGLSADKNSKPEIHEAHHRHLVNWALYRAFRIPDNDALNLGASNEALAAFEQYFGIRPDSDLRRITRQDVPHHVDAFWP